MDIGVLSCPRCSNKHGFIKAGSILSPRGRVQRWLCKCGKKFHPSLKTQSIYKTQGYLDIETSNLNAPFGIIYSWALKSRDKETIYTGYLVNWEEKRKEEQRILKELIDKLTKYDEIITWYGRRFDVPFLLSRSLYYRLPFPEYKVLSHTDLYYVAKYKLRMHSNRLNAVARFLKVKDNKTNLDAEVWNDVLVGNKKEFKKAMEYIKIHNIQDVKVLEQVHQLVEPYYMGSERSI